MKTATRAATVRGCEKIGDCPKRRPTLRLIRKDLLAARVDCPKIFGSPFTAHGSRLSLLVSLVAVASLTACGSIGEPLPPLLNVPERSQDLTARQTTEGIVLEWTWPRVTTEGMPLKDLDNFAVHRLQINQPSEVVSGERFEREGRFVMSLQGSELEAYGPGEKVRLTLPVDGLVGKTAVFGVRGASRRGRSIGFSNLVVIEVVKVPGAPGPPSLTVQGNGILAEWEASEQAAFYEVLRRSDGEEDFELLNRSEETRYLDSAVELGETYHYQVRSMASSATGEVEGYTSEVASVVPTDTFPPQTPVEVRMVATESSVELSWKPNGEPDLAGYRILRGEDAGPLQPLSAGLVTNPSYSDTSIEAARTYHYAVTAVDQEGNESPPSEAKTVSGR